MSRWVRCAGAELAALGIVWAAAAQAEPLTVERAVELALRNNTQVMQAEASVYDARGSLYRSYSGILPRFSAGLSRSVYGEKERTGSRAFAGFIVPGDRQDFQQYATSPSVSGTWSILNLSSISDWGSARHGVRAARFRRSASRNDVVFDTKRKYYDVVKAVHLAHVAAEALRLAHDDERRVRALFEVGSVSKSDVLKAQVRTAQGQLDSLTRRNAVTVQRIVLGNSVGVPESQLGEVDTTLTASARDYEEGALLAEAEKARPDLMASRAELSAAKSGMRSAQFTRLPYLTVSGSAEFNPKSTFETTTLDTSGVALPVPVVSSGRSELDRSYRAEIALNWDLFNGMANEAQIAGARARLIRAQDAYDVLHRNLAADVQQALLAYREAIESDQVAERAVESATENVKLTQQKYNVGSATILELIDAQVQLQRTQSDKVSALAAIRVAEAQIERVRGRGE